MEEYQKLLMDRYDRPDLDKSDQLLLTAMVRIPSDNGFEGEMLDWLNEHPSASLQEVARFEASFLTPLEIVDDDELDDEDED